MERIQTIYIVLLKYTYVVTKRIDETIRNVLIWLFSFLLISLCIYNYAIWSRVATTTQFQRDLLGCLCLAAIGLFSVNGELKRIKWNRKIVFIWYILGGLIFLSGLLHSVENSYWLWSFTMLIGFPGFYLIWHNRKDYSTLFDIISSAMLIILLIYFVICLCTVSSQLYISGRYWGVMRNPNHLGKVAASGMIAVLYLYFRLKDKYRWTLGIPGGICVILAILSGSRSSMIIMAAQLLVFISGNIQFCMSDRAYIKTATGMIGFILIGAAACFLAGKSLDYCQMVHDMSMVHASTVTSVPDETKESSGQQEESVGENQTISKGETTKQNSSVLANRFSVDGKSVDQISSGRITIWKYFIARFNLFGNNWTRYTPGTPEYTYQWAHNDVIEISYRSGVIAGVFDALFLVYLGIYVLKTMFSKRNKVYQFFTSFSIIAYCGYAMFEVISFPFSMQYTFMCFASLIPVFERRNELWSRHRKSR